MFVFSLWNVCDFDYPNASGLTLLPTRPGLRSVWACSLKLVLDKRFVWGGARVRKLGIQSWRGGVWGRYWVSRWGRRFPAFWLDSKQKMHELKCVARCRRDVIGWHLWERFWVDILKFFLKKWLIRFRWFLGARSRRMFMEVIFLYVWHFTSVFCLYFLLSPYLPYIRVFCYVSGWFVNLYRKTPFWAVFRLLTGFSCVHVLFDWFFGW